ncbi:MAG: M48 family metallopeptidase [Burkholderiales bacterium]|nr:M48 family metallopeptidase [Burkholderiales bacterium]
MTFFEGQALARRNTRLLVVMYLLAVVAVIVAVDLVIAALWIEVMEFAHGAEGGYFAKLAQVPGWLLVGGALFTGIIILGVSGYEVMQLADGGEKVAEMVGARRVAPATHDPLEKRLLNVVEEMSIASGVRLPKVYVMDNEGGINAFAAGYDISNAVVAVTRGTLESLSRDELQAVIGHEFSHILNGDMRLNIRMMGVLAGIVFIGAIGEFLMRGSSESRSRDGSVWGLFAAGLALTLIGYVGLFFARLIKAAVSRQREFLADASSVQFTRNPDGIAGALSQIDASSHGTLIDNRRAEDMSHMFFAQSVSVWLGALLDTHPPIPERIRRAHPRFDKAHYRRSRAQSFAYAAEAAAAAAPGAGVTGTHRTATGAATGFVSGAGEAVAALPAAGRRLTADIGQQWFRSAADSVQVFGSLDNTSLDYARRLLASLPAELRDSVHSADGACAAILALMLAPVDAVMDEQIAAATAAGGAKLAQAARALAPATRRLGPAFHLMLIDLALPAAKSADQEQRRVLEDSLAAVIHADRRVSLHEFVVLTLVRSQLEPPAKPGAAGNRRLADLTDHAMTVLSLIAHAGTRSDAVGERQKNLEEAIRAGKAEMGLAEAQSAPALPSMPAAEEALQALRQLLPMQKAILVKGLFAAVSRDGSIRVIEAELMRLVSAVLDCPLPPLLTGIDPTALAA